MTTEQQRRVSFLIEIVRRRLPDWLATNPDPEQFINVHLSDLIAVTEAAKELEQLRADGGPGCAVCCTTASEMLTDDRCVACERDRLQAENESLRKLLRPRIATGVDS